MSKLKTFLNDPIYSVLSKARPILGPASQGWAKRRLADKMSLDFLSKRPGEAIPPDFDDLLFLYEAVRKRKPKIVFEFGSGCSTVVITQAVTDNGNGGFVYSMETDNQWGNVTNNILPQNLKSACRIIYSPLQQINYEGIPVFRHSNVPTEAPDFLYLDSPPFTEERKAAIDVLDIEGTLKPGFFMVVDGRSKNVELMKKYLKRHFKFKHYKLLNGTTRTTAELLS